MTQTLAEFAKYTGNAKLWQCSVSELRELLAENVRLQEAKRHFSALADAKGKENCALRLENERLRDALTVLAP